MRQATCLKDEVLYCLEEGMRRECIRNILLSFEYIRKENIHLNLNLIFYYSKVCFYIRSFKRSIYFIRFFFANKQVTQSKRDNSSQIINLKRNFKRYLKTIIHSLLMPSSKQYRTSSFKILYRNILYYNKK
jgi:hypothetical protein